jgi:hypothetical protein
MGKQLKSKIKISPERGCMVLSIITNIFPLFHLFTFCLKNTVERYLTETTTKITHVHAHAHSRTHARTLGNQFYWTQKMAYFSYIMATRFSGGRSRSTLREPPTMGKQLVNVITCGFELSAPFCNLQNRTRTHDVLVIDLYELLGNPTI